jgi:RNA polymerase sigma-70 factor (ECF subfamily)
LCNIPKYCFGWIYVLLIFTTGQLHRKFHARLVSINGVLSSTSEIRAISNSMTNDKELLQKVVAKDHDAFKVLVDQYQALVINTCYHLLGNRQDAEDVAQEVFLQAYKSADKFRQEAKLSTWLYRIAVNRSLNFVRDNKRFRWLKSISSLLEDEGQRAEEIPASDSDRPDMELEKKERNVIVQKAIDSLPGKQRAAFVLREYEGLSYQEIAEILHLSLSSVASLIHWAKLNLQRKLIHYLREK